MIYILIKSTIYSPLVTNCVILVWNGSTVSWLDPSTTRRMRSSQPEATAEIYQSISLIRHNQNLDISKNYKEHFLWGKNLYLEALVTSGELSQMVMLTLRNNSVTLLRSSKRFSRTFSYTMNGHWATPMHQTASCPPQWKRKVMKHITVTFVTSEPCANVSSYLLTRSKCYFCYNSLFQC